MAYNLPQQHKNKTKNQTLEKKKLFIKTWSA